MTSMSDWWGTSTAAGIPLMGLDDRDLENRTFELERRAEDLQSESESLAERLDRATELMKQGSGEGSAERGAVTVRVDAQYRLTDIQLTAKSMHLPSTARLREAILDAFDAACTDMTEQLSRATGLKGPYSPLDAFIEAIPEVAAVLPDELRHPPKPSHPEPADQLDSEEEYAE